MQCPRDKSQLAAVGDAGGHGHGCSKCSGTWLPQDLLQSVDLSSTSNADLTLELGRSQVRVTGLGCPSCYEALNESLFNTIPVQWCPKCLGIWLSSSSLGELQAALQPQTRGPAKAIGANLALDLLSGAVLALFH